MRINSAEFEAILGHTYDGDIVDIKPVEKMSL
jgi:hypothetical protein